MLEAKFVRNAVSDDGICLQLSFDRGKERLFPSGRVVFRGTLKDGLEIQDAVSPGEGYSIQSRGGKGRPIVSIRSGFAGVPALFTTHGSGPIMAKADSTDGCCILEPFDMSTLSERTARRRAATNGKSSSRRRQHISDVDVLRTGIDDINTLAENMGAVLLLDDQGKLGATIKL